MFGYLPGGYGRMLERFEVRLREAGVSIRTGTPVSHVAVGHNGDVRVEFSQDQSARFNRVILTLPAPAISCT